VNQPLGSVRRIAVLRCNALGDYLMTTPALSALRYAFPQAELTLLGGVWHAEFLSGRPGPVDRVLVAPRVPGLAGQPGGAPPEGALPQFLAEARAYRYDLAVQLHCGGAASNPLVRALRARWSIGLRAQDAPPLDATVPYRYYQSEVFRFLEVVALVGAEGPPEYPELAVSEQECDAAAPSAAQVVDRHFGEHCCVVALRIDESSSAGVEGDIAVEHGEERRGRHGREVAAVRLAAHLADPLVVLVLVIDQRHQQRPGHDP
jgi:ADP-heptose:LPS heptosyltransferase